MSNRDDVRAFLRSNRAKITPHEVGVRAYSLNRRMPGLSQAEVAALAGVSVELYAELESGDLSRASGRMLQALAGALRLDDVELETLLDLARVTDLLGPESVLEP